MEKYCFEGVIKLTFNLKSKKSKKLSLDTLKDDFKMNDIKTQSVLKNIIEKLDKNTDLASIFPLDEDTGSTKLPLIFIETEEQDHIYVYENSETTKDNFNCFLLFSSSEDMFTKLKTILKYLKVGFSNENYKLNFNKPTDMEGYLISEKKELILYRQKLTYITSENLNFHEKVALLINTGLNKAILIFEIIIFVALIIVWFDKSIELTFLAISRKDLFLLIVPFLISNSLNLITLYVNQENSIVRSNNLMVYPVALRKLTKKELKTNREIAEVEEKDLLI